jgi:HD-GYP domain-containing protein (c-di-GMP phosphodiesterase class II)
MEIRELDDIVDALRALEAEYRLVGAEQDSAAVQRVTDGATALLALPALWSDEERAARAVASCGIQGTLLVCMGSHEEMARVRDLPRHTSTVCLALPTSDTMLAASLGSSLDLVANQLKAKERGQLAERYRFELGELIAIANAINSERDINRLLGLILEKSRYVTGADAGSIYVLIPDPEKPRRKHERLLRFEVAQNESVDVDFRSFTLKVSRRSIVGAAVIRREVIHIPDLYRLEEHNPWGVEHDSSFDERTGYRTRSVLTVPLINHRDQVIGVLQLINKKTTPGQPLRTLEDFQDKVVPFDDHSVELCKTLASQAGISLENALLYNELQAVFEGFVEASVQAIESRDPSTSGHSARVADLTVGLAEVVCNVETGPYAAMVFNADDLKAIEYAGLLHDFGKIGVPEAVLVKPRKLYDWQRDIVLARFDYIRAWVQNQALQKKTELLRHGDAGGLQALEDALDKQEQYLELCISTVLDANQPSVMDKDRPALLKEIAQQTYVDPRGETRSYLTSEELDCLSIARGSLNTSERGQIESHVVHTFNYLCSIPWGPRFSEIPRIAGAHHEKLDGSGYPKGLGTVDIPVQAKMMAIADIFDSLTASDRPYKKAVPWQRALDILGYETKEGKLDPELMRLFVEARVYRRTFPDAE